MTKEEFLNNFQARTVRFIEKWIEDYGDEPHHSEYWDRYRKEDGSDMMTSDLLKVAKEAKDIGSLMHMLRALARDVEQIMWIMLDGNWPGEISEEYLGAIPLDYDT